MKHTFVSVIPDKLDEGILYVSIQYNTALHKCACGCGEEVVTPITPSDWKITYNGESVSLYPSIGNWYINANHIIGLRKTKSYGLKCGLTKKSMRLENKTRRKKAVSLVGLNNLKKYFKIIILELLANESRKKHTQSKNHTQVLPWVVLIVMNIIQL